jgi:hypothetical protein
MFQGNKEYQDNPNVFFFSKTQQSKLSGKIAPRENRSMGKTLNGKISSTGKSLNGNISLVEKSP